MPGRITPPMPGPEMDRDTAEQLLEGFDAVRDSVDERAYGAARIARENIPAPLRLHSGPSMRFLYGYLLYKAADGSYAQHRAAIEHLEELVRTEPDYVLRHPEVHYFLARAQDAWFRQNKVQAKRINFSNSMEISAGLVRSGLGVSLLPRKFYTDDLENGRMQAVDLDPPLAPFTFSVISAEDNVSPLIRKVTEISREVGDFIA